MKENLNNYKSEKDAEFDVRNILCDFLSPGSLTVYARTSGFTESIQEKRNYVRQKKSRDNFLQCQKESVKSSVVYFLENCNLSIKINFQITLNNKEMSSIDFPTERKKSYLNIALNVLKRYC